MLPGFYAEIERLAEAYANAGLLATRCFFVDENEIITGLTTRIPELENGVDPAEGLYYATPMQFPGVVIRREFYEAHGGYMPSLVHTAIGRCGRGLFPRNGGVISTNVLACYRVSASNESAAVVRSGENVRDFLRLEEVFRKRYPGFSSVVRARLPHTWL